MKTQCSLLPTSRANQAPVFLKVCAAGLLVVATTASFSGCASRGTVAGPKVDDTVTLAPALKTLLATNPRPSVVLRTTSSAPSLTQAETTDTRIRSTNTSSSTSSGSARLHTTNFGNNNFGTGAYRGNTMHYSDTEHSIDNTYYSDTIYNVIEQEFIKHGFVVRDRQMLRTLLEKTEATLGYEELGRRLQADIIIEITGIDLKDYWQSKYTDDKGVTHTFDRSTTNKFNTPYRTLAGKFVITGEGAIGGFFEFNYCGEGGEVIVGGESRLRFKENPWKKYIQKNPEKFRDKYPDTKDTWKKELWFPPPGNNASAKYFSQQLIKLLTTSNSGDSPAD